MLYLAPYLISAVAECMKQNYTFLMSMGGTPNELKSIFDVKVFLQYNKTKSGD